MLPSSSPAASPLPLAAAVAAAGPVPAAAAGAVSMLSTQAERPGGNCKEKPMAPSPAAASGDLHANAELRQRTALVYMTSTVLVGC
jgi:hypothetical protein